MRKVLVAVVGAFLLALCATTQAAQANGISICTSDGENCRPANTEKLQAAVEAAGQGSVIKLTNGVYTEQNIHIKKNITIRGEEPRKTIIEGNALPCWLTTRVVTDTQRILEIAGGRVTIESLTIRNGCVATSTGDAQGGGIWSAGDLTLNQVILQDNVARLYVPDVPRPGDEPGLTQGGAIYNTGNMRIDSSSILSNTVATDASGAFGGGIYNNGTATLMNSTIAGNRAHEERGGFTAVGGGVHSSGTLLMAEYNSFVNNFATTAGGGLGADGPVRLVNNLFFGSKALAGAEDCVQVEPKSPVAGNELYAKAPPCETPRPPSVRLTDIASDTITPVYVPSVSLKDQSGSLNVANCTLSDLNVDQLGHGRGLGGNCDLGAVEVAMSFLPTLWSAPAKPDLRIRSVTIDPPPGQITAGTKVMITVVVENIGNLATEGRFYIDMAINPKMTPPNEAGHTWMDLCQAQGCEGVIWNAPPTITDNGGTYPFRTDLDNDEYVVRISSQFDRYLPAGPVDIWVYADSYDQKRSTKGLIDELTETNNQYHYPTFTVKPGRILPADADQQLTAAGQLPVGGPVPPTYEP